MKASVPPTLTVSNHTLSSEDRFCKVILLVNFAFANICKLGKMKSSELLAKSSERFMISSELFIKGSELFKIPFWGFFDFVRIFLIWD